MESGELALADSVVAYEQGIKLKAYCEQMLKEAELKKKQFQKWSGELVSAEAELEITPMDFIENYINQENPEDTFSLGYCSGNIENPFKNENFI